MTVQTRSLSLNTKGDADIHDLTEAIHQEVLASGITSGLVTVFCPSSTSGVTTIEYEPGACSDLRRLFDELAPPGRAYAHEAAWHDGNGHSHVRAALLGPSMSIPFVDRRLTLGTWQQVIYIDFDTRPRRRELVLQLIGE